MLEVVDQDVLLDGLASDLFGESAESVACPEHPSQ